MTLAIDVHPASRPGLPRRLFLTGWVLRQSALPLAAGVLFDLSTGGAVWVWLVAAAIACKILATLIQRRAWALSSNAGGCEANPPRRDVTVALLLASEVLGQVFTAALVFALALSASLYGMLAGILFAAALLGHFAADAAHRFLRVGGTLQQVMIARIVISAVLVVVSVTPALLVAQTGAQVASAALAVSTIIGVTGALTILTRPRQRS